MSPRRRGIGAGQAWAAEQHRAKVGGDGGGVDLAVLADVAILIV
ncbi:hypothetical protein [Amycolatopsis sp. cmx-4-61]